MMKKYILWLSAALIGCSATACVNSAQNAKETKNEKKADACASVAPQSGENLFANADATRHAVVAEYKQLNAKPVSKEQKKYNDLFNGKVWEVRKNAQKDLAAAEKGFRALFADQKASPENRYGILPVIVELYYRAGDYKKTVQLADEFLAIKEPAFRSSPSRVRLATWKLNALDRLRMYEKLSGAYMDVLAMNISEQDAFKNKLSMINSYFRASLPHIAEPYIWSMLNDPSLDQKQKIAAAATLVSAARYGNDLAKMNAALAAYRKFQPDNNEYAKMRLSNGGYYKYTIRNYPMALNMRKEIMEDKSLSTDVRVMAYCAISDDHVMFVHSSMDKNLVIEYAEKYVLPLKDLTPEQHYRIRELMFRAYRNYLRDDAKAEEMMRKVLAVKDNPQFVKVQASIRLAEILAAKKKYAEAEKYLNEALALPKLHPNDVENLCKTKAKLLSWQERCDDAVAFLRSKIDPKNQDTVRRILPIIADTYKYFLRFDDIIKIYAEFGNPIGAVNAAGNAVEKRYPDKAKAIARQVIVNEKMPRTDRIEAATFFLDTDAESKAFQKKYPDLFDACAACGRTGRRLNDAIFGGEYGVIFYILGLYEKANVNINYNVRLVQMQALASKQRFAEVGALAEKIAAFKTKDPIKDSLIFSGRMLKNAPKMKAGDYAAFCKNYAYPAGITQKEKSKMLTAAANLANVARLYDASREIYNVYQSMFVPEPKKTYEVSFSDKPILGLSDFLAIQKNIKPQLMNRKYGGNMDFLVTDVSTGDRGSAITSANDKAKYKPVEMRMVCDEYGIHMLFTVFDPESAKIATGLMGAGSFEMYLAPGENQPYLCFLPNLENGSCGIWNSSYNTRQWRQTKESEISFFRTQHQFTQDGYLFYMFISWKKFYDKLPEKKGDCWDFENIFWSRFGGYGWNGTKSIHGRSTWGKLDFSISDAQLRKIKRHIIVDASKAYKLEQTTTYRCHGAVDLWKNDDLLGDPAFFKAKVAPITDKLDADLKCVVPNMDDAMVDRLYREAVPGWYEIRLIIADLRRQYLEEEFSK